MVFTLLGVGLGVSGWDIHDGGALLLGGVEEFRLGVVGGDDGGCRFAGGGFEYVGAAHGSGDVVLIGSQGDFEGGVAVVAAADDEVGLGEGRRTVPGR